MDTHRLIVKEIADYIKGLREDAHESDDDAKAKVDTSRLTNILSVDAKAKIAMVEPNVRMDVFVRETLKHGLIPPIMPAFPGVTVEHAFSRAAAGSSSYLYGYFDRSITWLEAVLGDGSIARASSAHNADLFAGMVGSLGTVAIPTLFQIQLIEVAEYVEITYIPVTDDSETLKTMQRCEDDFRYDFVEAFIFEKNSHIHGTVAAGKLTPVKSHPECRFTRASDPWFYLHALEAGSCTESVPILDYLFRYDRGFFCLGRYFFQRIPFNKITRWLLDTAMHSRQITKTMTSMKWSQHFILQHLVIPKDNVGEFLGYAAENLGIYPLRLCSIRPYQDSVMRPNPLRTNKFISIGCYGYTEDTIMDLNAFEEKNRELERVVQNLGGLRFLYKPSYCGREEFWGVYSKRDYEELRHKFHAHYLPNVFDRVRDSGRRVYEKGSFPLGFWTGISAWSSVLAYKRWNQDATE